MVIYLIIVTGESPVSTVLVLAAGAVAVAVAVTVVAAAAAAAAAAAVIPEAWPLSFDTRFLVVFPVATSRVFGDVEGAPAWKDEAVVAALLRFRDELIGPVRIFC